ncbi:MAG TPA: 2OG-Fe dioxygenase family protein [Polyangiaceae bacterium]|nr:2OG-Fe dioxygenase family protein [Polyangiaceae bacterium]
MPRQFAPPYVAPDALAQALRARGYAALSPRALAERLGVEPGALEALGPSWADLPPDEHLRDGGRYRRRRHSCFVVAGERVEQAPHRAHWQPREYNALHGGIERWFEPVDPAVARGPVFARLLSGLGVAFSALKNEGPWFVEAHQFRIDTTEGIGRPTPEGAHRDGVDFVAVLMVRRVGVKGGETRVFDAEGPGGVRFTMSEPWSALLLDDERVIHESTPIQPEGEGEYGHRDTLVLTYRLGGFQGPP